MPTALGASRRHVSAAAVVATAALVDVAAVAGFVVTAPVAAAAITVSLAFLLGGAKEPEGPFRPSGPPQ